MGCFRLLPWSVSSSIPYYMGYGSISMLMIYLTGIAIGRLCLPFVNAVVGERRVVLIYIVLAGALQAVSWAVKSFVAVRLISTF